MCIGSARKERQPRSRLSKESQTLGVLLHVKSFNLAVVVVVGFEVVNIVLRDPVVDIGSEVLVVVAQVNVLDFDIVAGCGYVSAQRLSTISKRQTALSTNELSASSTVSSSSSESSATFSSLPAALALALAASIAILSFLSLTAFAPNFFSSFLTSETISFCPVQNTRIPPGGRRAWIRATFLYASSRYSGEVRREKWFVTGCWRAVTCKTGGGMGKSVLFSAKSATRRVADMMIRRRGCDESEDQRHSPEKETKRTLVSSLPARHISSLNLATRLSTPIKTSVLTPRS